MHLVKWVAVRGSFHQIKRDDDFGTTVLLFFLFLVLPRYHSASSFLLVMCLRAGAVLSPILTSEKGAEACVKLSYGVAIFIVVVVAKPRPNPFGCKSRHLDVV